MIQQVWEYDEDVGSMMCRCPKCGGRLSIGLWTYWNPYHFCPYCGISLGEGNFVRRFCQIYKRHTEEKLRNIRGELG